MSYVPPPYEAIVRDLLTTLTGGTVGETLTVPAGDAPLVLERLRNRPVRRVSHLEGRIAVGSGAQRRELDYRFTPADFELVAAHGGGPDTVRFRDGGRRPLPGSQLRVNYYPLQTDPVPLTDLNVGSVVRTLLETVARELAVTYLQLQQIYDSAFLDTATGSALDKVVALIGVERLPAGHPLAKVRFTRRAGTPGRITIPPGTAVTDAAGSRYLTVETLTLEDGESTREVTVAGETRDTPVVDAGALTRLEVMIAGIDPAVTNAQPARAGAAPESDAQLRRRAPGALHGRVRGTVDALRYGVLSIEGVKDVAITETPNDVPGELRLEVAYATDTPELRALVAKAIEELRPAGVRVLAAEAARLRVDARVTLHLAGAPLPATDAARLTAGVADRLRAHLAAVAPAGTVRRAKLASLLLEDTRVLDGSVRLSPAGQSDTDELTLPAGTVLEPGAITFAEPTYEQAAGPLPPTVVTVEATLPVHLVAGVTIADATAAIGTALEAHLASRGAEAPLTVDGIAAAIRDDTRFALVRTDVVVSVESGGRFVQLTDGAGSYVPAANETLQAGTVDVQPREGGV